MNTIITHSGTFHADEVVATAILKVLYPKAVLIRTRNEEQLESHRKNPSSILVDVGLLYDGKRLGDHHMNEPRLESYKEGFTPDMAEKETILIMGEVLRANRIVISDAEMNKAVSKYLNKTKFPKHDSLLSYIQGGASSYLSKRVTHFVEFLNTLLTEGDIREANGKSLVMEDSFSNKAKTLLQKSVLYRKLSSLGIVWKEYGEKYVEKYVDLGVISRKKGYELISKSDIVTVTQSIDFTFVRLVDLMDNGISYSDDGDYYSIGDVISNFNTNAVSTPLQDEAFKKAMAFARDVLDAMIGRTLNAMVIEKAVFEKEYVVGAELQVFSEFVPKVEYLLGKKVDENTLYYAFKTDEGFYRIMTVRKAGFSDKKSLPREWLSVDTNRKLITKGLRFVHQALFTAEFDTLENLKNALCLKS